MFERGESAPDEITAMYQSEAGVLGYATGERAAMVVQELRETQPPGETHFARIRFADEYKIRGVNAAIGAGVMIYDGRNQTLEVPWPTLQVLNRMRIPYARACRPSRAPYRQD